MKSHFVFYAAFLNYGAKIGFSQRVNAPRIVKL